MPGLYIFCSKIVLTVTKKSLGLYTLATFIMKGKGGWARA